MNRELFLRLAADGLRMPIGADLVLHEQPDAEAIKHDAARLGAVVAAAAERYSTPLAFPLMDLTLEKADLLSFLGVPDAQADSFHFDAPPSQETVDRVVNAGDRPFSARIQANQGAVRFIAERTALFPVGMMIGPFSLMTKLVADPIAPVAMSAQRVTSDEDEGVLRVERCLRLAEATVARSARAQIAAGARAIIMCEPAANIVYISPRMLRAGSDIFERYVLQPSRRVRDVLNSAGVDLIFHDCGELTTDMVRWFAQDIHPSVLSLGSSRKLWEDAAVVPDDVVLYGNLPTKSFYSDSVMPEEEVARRTAEILARMAQCGHPFILGSECDVLHVPDAAGTIRRKVDVMLQASQLPPQ